MTQICQRYSHNMSGAEIDFVLLTVIIFSVHADEHTTNMQNQIISLQDIVQKVLSDVSDIRQQYNVLEHKYNLLSDEFRLLRLNHVSSTKGVRTDEHSSQHVHPMFDHRSTVPSSSPETTLNQKGEQSYFGLQREANIPGFNGNNGQKGEKGDRGPKGDAGLPGFNGDDGYDGDKGEKGDPGIKGDAGIPGFNGDDGIDGPKGDKGEPGNSGIQGQKGNIGATGPAGLNGETGDIGPAGQKGNTGTPGPVGQKGNTGTPGQKGNTGTPGPVGQKGNTGTPGPAGQKGNTGTTGTVGQKGAPGMQGPIGLTGLKGQKGLKGDECSIYARIAFFARNDQTINVMAKEKIAFPNIGVNIGTTYERSGVFTCTVTGIYVFTWSTEVNPQKTLITLLLVNGIEHGRLIVQGSVSSWNIGSTTAVLRLSVTDRVYILQDFFTTGTILGNSSFSGFFLYQI